MIANDVWHWTRVSLLQGEGAADHGGYCERQVWGMKTSSRRQGRVSAVGSVRRPSLGRTGMSETRRFRPFAAPRSSGKVRPISHYGLPWLGSVFDDPDWTGELLKAVSGV
jgi:hypothetical protein